MGAIYALLKNEAHPDDKDNKTDQKGQNKHRALEWNPEAKKSFEDLRKALKTALVLAYPDLDSDPQDMLYGPNPKEAEHPDQFVQSPRS